MNDLKHYGGPTNPRAWPCIFKIILLVAVIGYLGERDHQHTKHINQLKNTCQEKS